MPSVLVIDDEQSIRYSLEVGLQTDDLRIHAASTGRQGIAMVGEVAPDAVILDVRLPDVAGLEVFDRIRQIDPKLPVVIITAFAATETAIEAMKRGAFEYLVKPVDLHQLREVVDKAVELRRMRQVPAVFEQSDEAEEGADRIIGNAPAMQSVYKAVGRVAPQDVSVLIIGESGTGKELVARAIYQHSRRAGKPFLAINCAAIPDALLESELFGHDRGAFTGADRQRIGKFEQADEGTLFLDEIGDMSLPTQAKVLRLLQEQRFERLGGQETIETNVRVIAATNQDLDSLVTAGKFRQDLYYRLNGFLIHLPPLRERKEDVPALVEHFRRAANRKLGKDVGAITPEAMRLLVDHAWPGNVRELQSAVRYGVLQASGDVLTVDALPGALSGQMSLYAPTGSSSRLDVQHMVQQLLQFGSPDIYRTVIQAVDRVVFESVLEHVGGNQVQASELLGISRTTLRAKLAALGIT
jgi:nitrogen regulation protein NR(I)